MISALEQKSIDAFVTFEPTPSIALQEVKGSVLVQHGGAPGVYAPGALLANTSWIAAHPAATTAVMTAFAQAEQLGRQHPNELAQIDTHWINNLTLSEAESAVKHVNFDPRISTIAMAAINKYTVPFLIKYNGMKPGFNPSTAIDASYLAAVEKQSPEYFDDLPPLPAGAHEVS
jgi:ABC-type nitrate/sulfonate/bicarbonate transport system substrate-binding protein